MQESMENNKSTMFVGLVCLDIFAVMEQFPIEDIGQRCEDCIWQRGGNAGNSAVVFSLLGGRSAFFGTLSDTVHNDFLLEDLKKYDISCDCCLTVENSSCPTSIVIINRSCSTRTVLHTNKKLRELTLEDFQCRINLSSAEISWIHFEGRDNAEEIFKMLSFVNEHNTNTTKEQSSERRIVTSLEAEKLRFATGMDKYNLWILPDILFVSKDFARSQGHNDMKTTVKAYISRVKDGATVVCAWGEDGAAAMSKDEGLVVSEAFSPREVVDTCGAGDTFNAAVIRALSQGKTVQEAIQFGCFIAGTKCGLQGFDGLKNVQVFDGMNKFEEYLKK